MLTKTKNIRKKSKKNLGRMAQGKPQPKFERNPCIRFRENCATDGLTDGWTTDDGQKSHTMTSADRVWQS